MELRWYWRILKRQTRVIWITVAVVAVLSLLYTGYSYYGARYKASETVEFSQRPPLYNTASIQFDPLSAAEANGANATGEAKLYTEGDAFVKAISAYVKAHYNLTIDYRNVKVGVTVTGSRQLKVDDSSSNQTTALHMTTAGVWVLQNLFLPAYQAKFQATTAAGLNFKQNVYEPPITLSIFDPLNARPLSLSSTVLGWVVKALLGLVLGIGLAFLWEYLDASIHDDQDVRNWMNVPTLGVIPGGKQRVA